MNSLRNTFFSAAVVFALGCNARAGGGGPGPVDTDGSTTNNDSGTPGTDAPVTNMDVPATGDDAVTSTPDIPEGDDAVTPPPDLPVGNDVVVGPSCGDGTCGKGESCTSCSRDCGACPATCGDGMCNGGETCTSCSRDCGACPNTCTGTSCETCTASTGCSWCRTTGACVLTSTTTCTDRVIAPSACMTTPPANITTACATSTTTAESNCGFRFVTTYSCTAGSTVTFGCTGGADAGACGFSGGACSGDPVLRVCAGTTTTGCLYANRLAPTNAGSGTVAADDDACGLCPWVRITCPSSGSLSVFTRAYNIANSASCSVFRQ